MPATTHGNQTVWSVPKYAGGPWRQVWPPKAGHHRCRLANRWFNSSFTEPHHLLPALCFFTTTGWPPSAVHDFIKAIRPAVGWREEWDKPKQRKDYAIEAWRRNAADYGEAFKALMNGDYGFKGDKETFLW